MGRKRYTIDIIRNIFAEEDYILTSDEYINTTQKLEYICPVGHKHTISWNEWQQGNRCGKCNRTTGKVTYDIVKQSFEDDGYILISTKYKNKTCKLDFICPEGHEHTISWNNWQRGQRCGLCYGNIKPSYEEVKQSFEGEGYTLISTEYINSHTKLDFICPNNHEHEIKWYSWKNGQRCGQCKYNSKPEREMMEYIKSIYSGEFVENDRSMIIKPETGNYLELDVWIPTENKAIEFNGYYWHSLPSAITNDRIKKNECERLGIELLIVEEMDWINDREKCEEIIKGFICVC